VFASHDHRLVALSVLVSILAAYAARDLAERVSDARGRPWLAWLLGVATVDGIGTWSMHYTGKLALRLPVPVQFDLPMVLLSLVVSVLGSAAALAILSRSKKTWLGVVGAGICLGGVGISGLHYTAMAAMRLPGMHHHYFSPALELLGVTLAIVISSSALAVTFVVRDDALRRGLRGHVGAVLRGSANPVMHYTAMAGVAFFYTGEVHDLSAGRWL
jgi:NO-binding membrane sensor protein with MHYT domain